MWTVMVVVLFPLHKTRLPHKGFPYERSFALMTMLNALPEGAPFPTKNTTSSPTKRCTLEASVMDATTMDGTAINIVTTMDDGTTQPVDDGSAQPMDDGTTSSRGSPQRGSHIETRKRGEGSKVSA
jgi:hypothetical protein